MIYRVKFSDIILSLFVEFAIILTTMSLIGFVLKPYFPYEEMIHTLAIGLAFVMGTILLFISGVGWKRNLNKLGLILLSILGTFWLMASLVEFLDMYTLFVIVLAYMLFRIGNNYAYSPFADRIVLIKRNPEYEVESGELEKLVDFQESQDEYIGN